MRIRMSTMAVTIALSAALFAAPAAFVTLPASAMAHRARRCRSSSSITGTIEAGPHLGKRRPRSEPRHRRLSRPTTVGARRGATPRRPPVPLVGGALLPSEVEVETRRTVARTQRDEADRIAVRRAEARPYVEAAGARFPALADEQGVTSALFGFKVVPNGILVDEHGSVRWAKVGGAFGGSGHKRGQNTRSVRPTCAGTTPRLTTRACRARSSQLRAERSAP